MGLLARLVRKLLHYLYQLLNSIIHKQIIFFSIGTLREIILYNSAEPYAHDENPISQEWPLHTIPHLICLDETLLCIDIPTQSLIDFRQCHQHARILRPAIGGIYLFLFWFCTTQEITKKPRNM